MNQQGNRERLVLDARLVVHKTAPQAVFSGSLVGKVIRDVSKLCKFPRLRKGCSFKRGRKDIPLRQGCCATLFGLIGYCLGGLSLANPSLIIVKCRSMPGYWLPSRHQRSGCVWAKEGGSHQHQFEVYLRYPVR